MSVLEIFETLAIPYHGLINTPNTIGLFEGEANRLLFAADKADKDKTWVNIGSHNGGSDILLELLKREKGGSGFVVSVDCNFSPFFDINLSRVGDYTSLNYKMEINSNLFQETFEKSDIPQDIGFAFVDGFHSFRQVVEDTKQLIPFLSPGTVICYHDCGPIFNDKARRAEVIASCEKGCFDGLFDSQIEDFCVDEALVYMINEMEFEYYDIPIDINASYFQQAGRDQYIRGETSPFNSLQALVYTG